MKSPSSSHPAQSMNANNVCDLTNVPSPPEEARTLKKTRNTTPKQKKRATTPLSKKKPVKITVYQANQNRQDEIVECRSKIISEKVGFIHQGMTTRAISKDNLWELVISIGGMKKVTNFIKQPENCPGPNSVIEDILENNCPLTIDQVHRFVHIDLWNSSILDDGDPPPS